MPSPSTCSTSSRTPSTCSTSYRFPREVMWTIFCQIYPNTTISISISLSVNCQFKKNCFVLRSILFKDLLKSGFLPKNGSYPKKSPKMTFPPLIIWAKALFFFEQLFPVVARTWLELKSECLFLAQNFGFWPKNPIFAIRPQFSLMTHF